LLNYYRDGNDSVAWHSDRESVLGKNPIIASVSFGQVRSFDIRNKATHSEHYFGQTRTRLLPPHESRPAGTLGTPYGKIQQNHESPYQPDVPRRFINPAGF